MLSNMTYRLFLLLHHIFRIIKCYALKTRKQKLQTDPCNNIGLLNYHCITSVFTQWNNYKASPLSDISISRIFNLSDRYFNIPIEPSDIMAKRIHQLRERLIFRFTSFPRIVRIQVYVGERQSSSNSEFWGTIWESKTKFVSLLKTNLGK
jgi:hypothetical protein